ncbi:MAG: orotidine-5'-phosphate decarboxylase [Patescibacteria group bacterium]|jgi:orotidine-5'-phosphate decarboxylase
MSNERFEAARKRIILPLDVPNADAALKVAEMMNGRVGLFKVGLELFLSKHGGHAVVERLQAEAPDTEIMLDLKIKDIPNTNQGAVRSVMELKPRFLTVHADSGIAHVAACVEAAGPKIGILGVTVLTSIDDKAYQESGGIGSIQDAVIARAQCVDMAKGAGIVCSPMELVALSFQIDSNLYRVVPGVRPAWAAANDQMRIMTPAEAIRAGASYLVIGRPILKPPPAVGSPLAAARLIAEEIASALE